MVGGGGRTAVFVAVGGRETAVGVAAAESSAALIWLWQALRRNSITASQTHPCLGGKIRLSRTVNGGELLSNAIAANHNLPADQRQDNRWPIKQTLSIGRRTGDGCLR